MFIRVPILIKCNVVGPDLEELGIDTKNYDTEFRDGMVNVDRIIGLYENEDQKETIFEMTDGSEFSVGMKIGDVERLINGNA